MVATNCAFSTPFSLPLRHHQFRPQPPAPVPNLRPPSQRAAFLPHRFPMLRFRSASSVITAALSRAEHAYIFQRSPFNQFRERLYASRQKSPAMAYPVVAEGDHAPSSPPGEDLIHRGCGEGVTPVKDRLGDEEHMQPLMQENLGTFERGGANFPGEDRDLGAFTSRGRSESRVHFDSHAEFVEAMNSLSGDPLQGDGGRIVVYRGNPKAQLMIIGEAPGAQEDREGKPFVGDAGKLLDKIFAYGGFDMERQVYVTNVAKRRPLGNRTPTDDEVEFYLPYLKEEIRLVCPKVIVLTGGSAARAMLGPDARITRIRGEWFTYEGQISMMAVYHPAYLLRKPVAKYDMVVDIEEIRAKYLVEVADEVLKPLVKKAQVSRR